jgi:hypothetical protein
MAHVRAPVAVVASNSRDRAIPDSTSPDRTICICDGWVSASEMSDESYYDDDPGESLVATYSPDEDGTGKLCVSASTQGFSGHSAAWFATARLLEFAGSLSAFPIPDGTAFEIASGFRANERAGYAPPGARRALSDSCG